MQDESANYNQLNDNAQKFETALKYTNGDAEKAKLMVSGQYKDVDIIKGKFSIDEADLRGFFMCFLNIPNRYVMNISLILFQDKSLFEKARIFDKWSSYYSHCEAVLKKVESIDSEELTNHFFSSIDGYDVFSDMIDENYVAVSDTFTEIIKKFYNLEGVVCKIEVEKSSSLELISEKIPLEDPYASKKEKIEQDIEEDVPQIEKEAEFLIEAKVIVSPVRGKYVNDIKIDDVIKILPVNKSDLNLKIAKSLNALNEEKEFLPISGKVKEKTPLPKSGYIIYCLIAKNIIAKIVEEENVKIETSQSLQKKDVKKASKESDKNIMLYVALLIGLLILTVFIIYALF